MNGWSSENGAVGQRKAGARDYRGTSGNSWVMHTYVWLCSCVETQVIYVKYV